jgi:hypothetical protein
MAAIKLTFWRRSGASTSHTPTGDSLKGREIIRSAYKKSGGPTKEFNRVYGEYLAYKRAHPDPAKT